MPALSGTWHFACLPAHTFVISRKACFHIDPPFPGNSVRDAMLRERFNSNICASCFTLMTNWDVAISEECLYRTTWMRWDGQSPFSMSAPEQGLDTTRTHTSRILIGPQDVKSTSLDSRSPGHWLEGERRGISANWANNPHP